MDNKIILSSLAMDLKRAALGWHRNSNVMAEKFFSEALKRKSEVDENKVNGYIKIILNYIEKNNEFNDTSIKAENALMYSILIQNFVLYK